MPRETLIAILERAPGLRAEAGVYRVAEGHEVTLYLGAPGRAMPVQNVTSMTLHDAFVEIEAKERGHLYVTYDAIHAVADGAPKNRRQGGTVGF